jgi:hypothetical protein
MLCSAPSGAGKKVTRRTIESDDPGLWDRPPRIPLVEANTAARIPDHGAIISLRSQEITVIAEIAQTECTACINRVPRIVSEDLINNLPGDRMSIQVRHT